MTDSDAIADLYVFRTVPRAAIDELVALAPPRAFPAGAVIYGQGQAADHALLVVEGRIEASLLTGERRRKLGEIGPGEILGELGLFNPGARRNATATALLPSRCLVISRELMIQAAENPAMVALETYLMGSLARRIRTTNIALMQAWKETAPRSTVLEDSLPATNTLLQRLRRLFGGT